VVEPERIRAIPGRVARDPRALRLPRGLEWWAHEPGGAEWLERLPRLIEDCVAQWSLTSVYPFEPAHLSYVAGVVRDDATRAVLKINFPDPESEHEPDALAHWNGKAAVRLFAHDRERRALLIERCEPGTRLWDVDEDAANSIAIDVLRSLRRAPPRDVRFRRLADEAASWRVELENLWEPLGRPFERDLLDTTLRYLDELAPTQPEEVVCHQDFHGGNVLLSVRGWLVIDPKPLLAEPAFDAASLLRDRRPVDRETVCARLDRLARELDLDRERMRGWGIVHALAWGLSVDKVEHDMVACARALTNC
jgi:streptomycin 6-kinase